MSIIFNLIKKHGGDHDAISNLHRTGNYIYFTGNYTGHHYTVVDVGKIFLYTDDVREFEIFNSGLDLLKYFGWD